MDRHFEILFLDEAFEFLSGLERKHCEKSTTCLLGQDFSNRYLGSFDTWIY